MERIIEAIENDPVNSRVLLSASFSNFIKVFHWYLYKNEFIFKDFHKLIIRKLEDIAFGRNVKRNLVINIPPRFGKSSIMKYFCAWSYMLNPHSNNIYTSYSDDLVNTFSKDIRGIVESKLFNKLTGVSLNKGRTGADYWETTLGGGFRAAPLGGSITGFGFGVTGDEFGGCCLIDDALKASNVKSQAEIQNCIDYYLNTLKSRANNQAKAPIVMIMQRLSQDDLTGYVLENESEDWDLVKIPALNEDTGEALWEEKFPAKELLKLKDQAPFVYWGQYQQEPIVVGGSVFKTEWFKYYNTEAEYYYQSAWFTADTAQKKGEANDFTVLCCWGKTNDNRLHLIDMVRGKYDAPELRQQIILMWEKWKGGIGADKCPPYGFYIEDKSSGIGAIQEIKKTYPIPLLPISRARYKSDGLWMSQDKYSRALTAIPYIANGWVYLPNAENDSISAQVLAETAAFRADLCHKHDDICFAAGTKIATLFGDKPIEKIKEGEFIITPYGISRVGKAKCTGIKKTITKFGLTATPNHKIFNNNVFQQLDSIDDINKCDILSLGGLIKWKYKRLLNSMVSNTDLWGRKGIISLSQTQMRADGMLKDFMLRFGSFIRERKFLKATLFTIKTITILTTSILILSAYHVGNIWNYTKKTVKDGLRVIDVKNILTKLGDLLRKQNKDQNTKKNSLKESKHILQSEEKKKSVQLAEESLQPVMMQKNVADVKTQDTIENGEEKVYNLTITSDGVYYANRVLVSNCDNIVDAVDIAFGATGISSIFI